MMITLTTDEEKRAYYKDVLTGVFALCLNIHKMHAACALFSVLHSVIHDLEPFQDLIEADEYYCEIYYKLINYHNEIAKRKFGVSWLNTSTEKPVELYIADKIET